MVDADLRRSLRIGLYHSLPSICVYAMDDRSFVSFFLRAQLAVKTTQLEVCGHDSVIGQLVQRETAARWQVVHEIDDIAAWTSEAQRARPRLRGVEGRRGDDQPVVASI